MKTAVIADVEAAHVRVLLDAARGDPTNIFVYEAHGRVPPLTFEDSEPRGKLYHVTDAPDGYDECWVACGVLVSLEGPLELSGVFSGTSLTRISDEIRLKALEQVCGQLNSFDQRLICRESWDGRPVFNDAEEIWYGECHQLLTALSHNELFHGPARALMDGQSVWDVLLDHALWEAR